MGFRQKLQAYHNSSWKYIVTVVLVVILLLVVTVRYGGGLTARRQVLVYSDSLDMVAVTVNGVELTLRDLAFYVAYEEGQVEEMAIVYDPDDPGAYWNVHTDGTYVSIAARNAALQMAIHDEIFYEMALGEEIELSDDDLELLADSQYDFWSDLEDRDGAEKLGVTEDVIDETMEKIALAQKYQGIYAELMGRDYEDYDFDGSWYEDLLDEQDYEINKSVWRWVDVGNVTLEH
ncbi:MAG: hypothetical protein LUI02_06465 [Clostridiales bacterium]|nr:hypothetical protein [Clostridiales bacterium]